MNESQNNKSWAKKKYPVGQKVVFNDKAKKHPHWKHYVGLFAYVREGAPSGGYSLKVPKQSNADKYHLGDIAWIPQSIIDPVPPFKGNLKGLEESFNVHYPQLKKLVNMEYGDPRQKDGCSIVAEKCGKMKKEGRIIEGSYIMYEDSEMKGKYIAVHVSDAINEESGEPEVSVIAIGSKKSVRERMGYRMRKNKNLEESRESILNKKLI